MKLLELISYITLCSFAIAILAAIAYYSIDEAEKNCRNSHAYCGNYNRLRNDTGNGDFSIRGDFLGGGR